MIESIWKMSASSIVRQDRRRVARLALVDRVGVGASGFAVYMIQCLGRGAVSSTCTRNIYVVGNESKPMTASFAAAFAKSLPRMFMCAMIFCRVMRRPIVLLGSWRSVMLPIRSMW